MYTDFKQHLNNELTQLTNEGLFKHEREIQTPQSHYIDVTTGANHQKRVLNLCANNYLGLAQHPEVNQAAKQGIEQWGYGMASVRFICGTQSAHKALEAALSQFLKTDDCILYASCFDANGGLFSTLLTEQDAVISDELNHASIIDGVRLCKAKRYRYRNNDMQDLEAKLIQADAEGARFKLITTDGVFSMDGYIARLDDICELAEHYNALVHFDDCHATGFLGPEGRGTHELKNCMNKVDIITGTLGKALGGASGGYTAGHKEIIALLRQRSRPYLFSNTLAPSIVAGALKALQLISSSSQLRRQLLENTQQFRNGLTAAGFSLLPGNHPIIPVMFYEADLAVKFADALFDEGIYVSAFTYPVVPKGQARIRTQMSAALTQDDVEFALAAFANVKSKLNL